MLTYIQRILIVKPLSKFQKSVRGYIYNCHAVSKFNCRQVNCIHSFVVIEYAC